MQPLDGLEDVLEQVVLLVEVAPADGLLVVRGVRLGGSHDEREGWEAKRLAQLPAAVRMQSQFARGVKRNLGYLFPLHNGVWEVNTLERAAEAYTPVLTQTWADAYLADPLYAAFGRRDMDYLRLNLSGNCEG